MMSVTSNHRAMVSLQGDRQIVITREFDAPKELVWRAFTTPEHVRRWWHANRGEITEVSIDLQVGGRWRYAMHAPTSARSRSTASTSRSRRPTAPSRPRRSRACPARRRR